MCRNGIIFFLSLSFLSACGTASKKNDANDAQSYEKHQVTSESRYQKVHSKSGQEEPIFEKPFVSKPDKRHPSKNYMPERELKGKGCQFTQNSFSRTAEDILRRINQYHYLHPQIDNDAIEIIISNFISEIDPGHHLFVQSEIDAFREKSGSCKNNLKRGDISLMWDFFWQAVTRQIDRSDYQADLLENDPSLLDYSLDEVYTADRSDLFWPPTLSEQKAIWRSEIKNSALVLYMNGDSQNTVKKRLAARIQRTKELLSAKSEDHAFKTIMNTVITAFDSRTMIIRYGEQDNDGFMRSIALSMVGVGLVLENKGEGTRVYKIVPGGPADLSGNINLGDRIVGIGEGLSGSIVDVGGAELEQVVSLLRGTVEGSDVVLQIIPRGSRRIREVSLKRARVELNDKTCLSSVLDIDNGNNHYKIGVIRVPAFYLEYKNRTTVSKSVSKDINPDVS